MDYLTLVRLLLALTLIGIGVAWLVVLWKIASKEDD